MAQCFNVSPEWFLLKSQLLKDQIGVDVTNKIRGFNQENKDLWNQRVKLELTHSSPFGGSPSLPSIHQPSEKCRLAQTKAETIKMRSINSFLV